VEACIALRALVGQRIEQARLALGVGVGDRVAVKEARA
jgi:hypothetical protein